MDESEDSDIQILGEDKNKKEDSSDYVPPKSADSSDDPSSSIQEIDENEESPPTEESPVAQERPALTPRRSGKNSKLVRLFLYSCISFCDFALRKLLHSFQTI